jgi:hypothetical protein
MAEFSSAASAGIFGGKKKLKCCKSEDCKKVLLDCHPAGIGSARRAGRYFLMDSVSQEIYREQQGGKKIEKEKERKTERNKKIETKT